MLVMSHHHTAVQLANCSILQDQTQRSFCLRSRSSSVEQLVDKAGLSADENDQPWMTSLYMQYVARYGGARPCEHLNTRTASLNVIRFRTGKYYLSAIAVGNATKRV